MTGKALADVTTEERKGAKAVNFGAIYGQGAARPGSEPRGTNSTSVLDLGGGQGVAGGVRGRLSAASCAGGANITSSAKSGDYIVIGKDARTRDRPDLPEEPRSRRRVVLHPLLQSADSGRLRRRFDAGARLCRRSAVRRRDRGRPGRVAARRDRARSPRRSGRAARPRFSSRR